MLEIAAGVVIGLWVWHRLREIREAKRESQRTLRLMRQFESINSADDLIRTLEQAHHIAR